MKIVILTIVSYLIYFFAARKVSRSTSKSSMKHKGEPVVKTCPKGLYNHLLNGFCTGKNDFKQKINKFAEFVKSLDMSQQPLMRPIKNEYLIPAVEQLQQQSDSILKDFPSGCLGNIGSNYLLTNLDSIDARCGNFPLPKNLKLTTMGFSVPKFPCGTATPVTFGICQVFDKCENFAISISGGVFSCLATVFSEGMASFLSAIGESAEYIQFGYSPARYWTQNLTILDSKNFEPMRLTLRSHLFLSSNFEIPELGVKIGEKDITDYVGINIDGKFYVDFGDKNDYTPDNFNRLMNNNNLNATMKIQRLVKACTEHYFQGEGQFTIKTANFTNNTLPDFKEAAEFNILTSLGPSPDGDMGSSGIKKVGMHGFFRPKSSEFLTNFVKPTLETVSRFLKVANQPSIPLPSLEGMQFGFFIGGDMFMFKIKTPGFMISCVAKYNKSDISCKHNSNFITMFLQAGKWVSQKTQQFFGNTGEFISDFPAKSGDFRRDVEEGAVEFFDNLVAQAKELYDVAAQTYEDAKKATKEAQSVFDEIDSTMKKLQNDAFKKFDDFRRDPIGELEREAKRAAKDVENFFKDPIGTIGGLFKWLETGSRRLSSKRNRMSTKLKGVNVEEETKKREETYKNEIANIEEQYGPKKIEAKNELDLAKEAEEAAKKDMDSKENLWHDAERRRNEL